MENLLILTNESHGCIKRCGTVVLHLYTPTVTGDTAAARHAAAMIKALTDYATTAIAAMAEQTLREAVKRGKLLHFTPHTVRITLTKKEEKAALCLSFSLLHQSGDGVKQNEVLCTYWRPDQAVQYRRMPKRILLFSRAALRGRAKCDKI